MTILRTATDPRWVEVALSDLDATLADHAHCEKKAVATAVKLVADHPDRPGMVRALARLAQEELQHFLAMLAEVERRGRALPPDRGDPYVQQLLRLVRGGAPRLVDQLLVGAFVEARSCERMRLLGERLPEARLRQLYQRLAQSEEGHERLFVDLALEVALQAGGEPARAAAQARLGELAEAEAAIVAALPLLPRMH
jgi:tRNA 2-(methylsulfanyl)-N6-isopentenyladenosine37 hydroxylase